MQLKSSLFPLFFTGSMFISLVSSHTSLTSLTDPRKYNAKEIPKYISPEGTSASVNIIVSMKITDITISTGYSKDYFLVHIGLKVKLLWFDSRLKYDSRNVQSYIFTRNDEAIWKPPLVLLTVTDASFQHQYAYFHIYPNSTVTEDILTTVELKQLQGKGSSNEFSIRLICLNHTMDSLTLEWDDVNPLEVSKDADVSPTLGNGNFHVRTCHLSSTQLSRKRPGNYSCLEIYAEDEVTKLSPTAMVYIPGILVVVISWTCFWIAVPSLLSHVAILTACLLHLFVQKISLVKDFLNLENIRMLYYWLDVCLGFVFAVFFQVVCVTYLYSTNDRRCIRSQEENLSGATTIQEEEEEGIVELRRDGEAGTVCNHFHFLRIWFNRFPSTHDAINAICRVLFPLCFVVFMCVFFSAHY